MKELRVSKIWIIVFAAWVHFADQRETYAEDIHQQLQFSEEDVEALRHYLFNIFDKNSNEPYNNAVLKVYEPYFHKGFKPEKFWSDGKIALGYGKNADGDLILVSWVVTKDLPQVTLADAKEIFLDGLFAEVTNERQLMHWQSIRKDVAGALMNVRLQESKVDLASGIPFGPTDRLEKQMVTYKPFVVRIERAHSKDSLLSATRVTD